jgi:hypothetical protein
VLQNKIAALFLCSIVFLAGCAAPTATPMPTSTATATETSIPAAVASPAVTATRIGLDSTPTPAGGERNVGPEALVVHPQTFEGIPGMDMNMEPIDGAKLYQDMIGAFATGPQYKDYWAAAGVRNPTYDRVIAYGKKYASSIGKDGEIIWPESVKGVEFPFFQSNGTAGLGAFKPNPQAQKLGYIDVTDLRYIVLDKRAYDENLNGVKDYYDRLAGLNAGAILLNDTGYNSPSGIYGFYVDERGRVVVVGAQLVDRQSVIPASEILGYGNDAKVFSAMVHTLINATGNLAYSKRDNYAYDPNSPFEDGESFYIARVPDVSSYGDSPLTTDNLFTAGGQ